MTPELIQAQSFSTAFRGFDQAEVRSFLGRVAEQLRAWQERAGHLESSWRSAEERAARPPVLDEDTLMAAVGEETASILRSARSAAGDLRAKAADEAEKLLGDAKAEAERIRAEARAAMERATSAAEEAAARIVATARAEAADTLEKARSEADKLRAAAEQDRKLTIDGANATRDRILEDLARRRRVATVQIEQLRAGRERLIESYAVVRRTLEEAQTELSRADAEARAAADEVGRRMGHLPGGDAPSPEGSEDPGAQEEDGNPLGDPAGEEAGVTGDAEGTDAVAAPPAPAAEEGSRAPALTVLRGGAQQAQSAVDELFARIKADGGAPRTEEAAQPAAPGTDGDGTEEESARAGEVRSEDESSGAGEDEAAETSEETAESGVDRRGDEEESLLQRRESALADLETALTRHLKRALQDEQNDVLDRLRSLRGEPSAAGLLPDPAEQSARFAAAARAHLERAAMAGAAFARSGASVEVDVSDIARDAADGIAVPLRRRLEQAVAAGDGDQAVLVEALGAAYREWKTQRIERIAGDAAAAAFARGTWEAVPEGTRMRWVVEDIDGPCPDCDDDALAGELSKGEPFPTGQHHPPAHSGCRCLLVPVAASA